jgi:tetratricopeptide (TPR) repeat protein
VSLAAYRAAPRTIDLVLRASGVGHRFPGGTMDSNEVWLEVEAWDGAGRVVAASGRGPSGELEPDAHLVRVQAVDGEGRPIARRDPQHARGAVYDAALGPSDPRAVRYLVPPGVEVRSVRARLLYRKFSPAYARLACAAVPDAALRRRCAEPPVVEVARAELALAQDAVRPVPSGAACAEVLDAPGRSGPDGNDPDLAVPWRRLVNHGVALADALVEQAPEALPYLECARAVAPGRVEPLLGEARLALALGQTDEAVRAALAAEALVPDHPAALLVRARALYNAYRFAAARPPVERLAAVLPDDRAALALLARVRGVTGDAPGALAAAERLLALDPESEEGHYQRALALRELGRTAEAGRAEALYLRHRNATEIDLDLRQRFRVLQPGRASEDVPVHAHTLHPTAAR